MNKGGINLPGMDLKKTIERAPQSKYISCCYNHTKKINQTKATLNVRKITTTNVKTSGDRP